MKRITLVVLLVALVVCLAGCSQKKIDELTATFNTEKESLQAQITEAQESLKSLSEEKDALIAEGQAQLEAAKTEAQEKYDALVAEKDAAAAKAEEALAALTEQKDALIADAQTQIDALSAEKADLQAKAEEKNKLSNAIKSAKPEEKAAIIAKSKEDKNVLPAAKNQATLILTEFYGQWIKAYDASYSVEVV